MQIGLWFAGEQRARCLPAGLHRMTEPSRSPRRCGLRAFPEHQLAQPALGAAPSRGGQPTTLTPLGAQIVTATLTIVMFTTVIGGILTEPILRRCACRSSRQRTLSTVRRHACRLQVNSDEPSTEPISDDVCVDAERADLRWVLCLHVWAWAQCLGASAVRARKRGTLASRGFSFCLALCCACRA
jgi:hypothetical protein